MTVDELLMWILPLVPVVTALLMLLVRDVRALAALDLLGSLVVLALAVVVAARVPAHGPLAAGPLRADALGVPFLLLIGFLAVTTALYSIGWIRGEVTRGGIKAGSVRYYYALVHGFIATMLVTVLADNLGILWIAMEGTTITSAILVGFHGHGHGLEAAWKYIIVTTIGISLGLFGTVLVYAAAAHAQGGAGIDAMSWSQVASISSSLDPGIVRIGFIFVIVGYGTKAGLAPMHMWLPDAHSQAPTPVSALLSGALIKCALLGIIRFHTIARGACGPELSGGLLILFGIVSVLLSAPFILAQRDVKRLFGYSSVEHVGIIALGLGFGGRLGTYAALLHVISHGVTKALVFCVAGDAIGRYGSRDVHAIRGLLRAAPWVGTLLLVGAFALSGVPPSSVFISELLVVRGGVAAGQLAVVALMLAAMVAIFAGLVHQAGRMAYGDAPAGAARHGVPRTSLAAMLLLAAVVVLLGLFLPPVVDRMLARATEVVLG
ncbi:MAG TPA: hydrogenase 4 subunit F [Kofleriaceae bacterium]|jgi:hydrogenase-4 component F|nr:hydrogenase 4 subunit F [Kofleriaceae bacterium]